MSVGTMAFVDRAAMLYDDDCGFCRWSASKILAWDRDRRVRPVALQSDEADTLLGGLDRDRKSATWHLVTPGGRVYSGGDAVAPLARLLPAGAPVAALAEALPGVTNRAYAWVSGHRDLLCRFLGPARCSVRVLDSATGSPDRRSQDRR